MSVLFTPQSLKGFTERHGSPSALPRAQVALEGRQGGLHPPFGGSEASGEVRPALSDQQAPAVLEGLRGGLKGPGRLRTKSPEARHREL